MSTEESKGIPGEVGEAGEVGELGTNHPCFVESKPAPAAPSTEKKPLVTHITGK